LTGHPDEPVVLTRQQEETMRRIIAVATMAAAFTVPLAGTAAADAGGAPNDNANTQTGNADPHGRKGSCSVPGDPFSQSAKGEGPNHPAGMPNGQVVKLCIRAGR
jgi:hypothetical protein